MPVALGSSSNLSRTCNVHPSGASTFERPGKKWRAGMRAPSREDQEFARVGRLLFSYHLGHRGRGITTALPLIPPWAACCKCILSVVSVVSVVSVCQCHAFRSLCVIRPSPDTKLAVQTAHRPPCWPSRSSWGYWRFAVPPIHQFIPLDNRADE